MNLIGRTQSDILQKSDENNELIDCILPSLVGSANVAASEVHDKLASTKISTHTEKSFLTNIEGEQLQQFLQQEDCYEGKLLCSACLKRECPDCDPLSKRYCQKECDVYCNM